MKIIIGGAVVSGVLLASATFFINNGINKNVNNEDYRITNVKIYKGTPVWELALAVKGQKTRTIEKIVAKKPELLNFQDPKYGATLLLWAIGREKYKSAETLLKCGADPDIAETNYGETPLFLAAGFSWIDNHAKQDPKYVNLLINYGADLNKCYIGINSLGEKSVIESGTSPLMYSIGSGIEKTKALVEAGADINYKNTRGKTAAISALNDDRYPEYAYYLIAEKKAKITEPYFRRHILRGEDSNEGLFPVHLLRNWIFDLDSQEYKMKMEIVEEFARQGVDYWESPIHESILEQIKFSYPDTWEEYVKKY